MTRRLVITVIFMLIVLVGPIMTVASGPHIPMPTPKPDPLYRKASYHTSSTISDTDIALYRKIFKAQDAGNWAVADQHMSALNSHMLMGHVLYQRYMHAHYFSRFNQLSDWLTEYADHPGANAIYTLAMRKNPQGAALLRNPGQTQYRIDGLMPSLRQYAGYQDGAVPLPASINRVFRRHLAKGQATAALNVIRKAQRNKEIKPRVAAQAKARIAATYLHLGHIDKAQKLALESLKQAKGDAAIAGWVSGLTAWRARDYAGAAAFFERTAAATKASAWTRSAGAYWAARAHMRVGNHDQVVEWLEQAASYPRSFYGLIATRALNRKLDFNWRLNRPNRQARQMLEGQPFIQRAEALIKAGRRDLAERELMSVSITSDMPMRHAIGAFAVERNLPGFSMRYSSLYRDADGAYMDLGLYPANPWLGEGHSNADEALINAYIRQESRFRTTAENPSGAVGLMQIMPRTASYVTGNERLSGPDRDQLRQPEINIQIGRQYLHQLLELDAVGGDLFSLAIAYNAGPGNLARWKRTMAHIDDPLLFIEMIPMSETRAFVERVMANYWIYSDRFGQATPSLEAVASGTWPVYAGVTKRRAY